MTHLSPRITLVIPNYNSGKVIARCLESIFSQNYPQLELILADGGSNDESIKICQHHRSRFNRFTSEPDSGISEALNKAFNMATGDIFAWLAADDELAPGALDHVTLIFAQEPKVDVVTGGCRRYFPDDTNIETTPPEDLTKRIRFQNVIEQPSTFWRSALHKKVGKLDSSLKLAFDWEFWCRFNKAKAQFKITPKILSHYHFSEDNLTSCSGDKIMKEMFKVVSRYGPYWGTTAYLYRFLFHVFDLHGCYDNPPTSTKRRQALFYSMLPTLYAIFGKTVVHGYNWSFVSRQMRNKKWYSSE
ncbi:MAG: glycosyltransferase family 2 protein [Thiotrichaceae bacterium]